MVQWLRLHAPSAEGPGLTPGQGTRSHKPKLRPGTDKKQNKQKEQLRKQMCIKNDPTFGKN